MRNYELFLILEAKKDEATAQKIIRDVEAVLSKYGAKVTKSHQGQSFRLAYQINKRRETFQIILEIASEPSQIAEIKRSLGLVNQVLRFSLLTMPAVKQAA